MQLANCTIQEGLLYHVQKCEHASNSMHILQSYAIACAFAHRLSRCFLPLGKKFTIQTKTNGICDRLQVWSFDFFASLIPKLPKFVKFSLMKRFELWDVIFYWILLQKCFDETIFTRLLQLRTSVASFKASTIERNCLFTSLNLEVLFTNRTVADVLTVQYASPISSFQYYTTTSSHLLVNTMTLLMNGCLRHVCAVCSFLCSSDDL